jgi:RNA polymerase sigma factor (sigma-70 family)
MLTKYQGLIRSMVLKIAGRQVTSDDVDDLVSSINVELLDRKLAAYVPGKGMELTTYVGMIAKRFTIDAMRKNKERTGGAEDVREEEISDISSNALTLLLRKEQQSRVRHAIEQLPDREKELICAMMEDGFTTETYAAANGMTPNAVYILRCRSLKRLKGLLRNGDQS